MVTYFMFGKYTTEAVKGMSPNRTKDATTLINKLGGNINAMYVLLGRYDLVLIVDFPLIQDVMKASLALTKLTGIGFTTSPAISVEEFDKTVIK